MTCRHKSGDPACSATQYISVTNDTPDPRDFRLLDLEDVGPHLVVNAKYPTCRNCSYEGVKIMVFLNTSIKTVALWEELDPHFRSPEKSSKLIRRAPSPDARFPGSTQGWEDGIAWAASKAGFIVY